MKSIFLVSAVLLCTLLSNSAGSLCAAPWGDPASIEIEFVRSGSTGWTRPVPLIDNHYNSRFGDSLSFMIWEKEDIPCHISWAVIMEQQSQPFAEWSDIIRYLYLKKVSSRTNQVTYIQLDSTMVNWIRGPREAYNGNAEYDFNLDYRRIHIPADSSAWWVTVELWESSPDGGLRLATADRAVTVAKSNILTAIDSLMWAKDANELQGNPVLCRELLQTFPANRSLLLSMFDYYLDGENCDSIHTYAVKMLESWKNRSDTYYLDRGYLYESGIDPDPGPIRLKKRAFDNFINTILNTCNDTTGLSQYAP